MCLWAFRFVLFYLLVLLVQPQNRFPVLWGWRIALICILISTVLHIASASQEGRPILRFGPATITALLVLLFTTLSSLFGPMQRHGAGWNESLDIIFKNCMALILIEALATTVERVWAVFVAIYFGTLWWIKGGLRLSSAGATYAGDRLWSPSVSLIENPNGFAFMMTLMIPIYVYIYFYANNKYVRWGSLFCALSAVYIVLQTGSRTGILCLVACGATIIPKLSVRKPTAVIIAGFAIFFFIGTIGALNVERYKTIFGSMKTFASGTDIEELDPATMNQDQQSAWERKMKNKHSWRLIKQYPVFGVGIYKDNWQIPHELRYARDQVHNEWLYIGVQMGFIGMALYAALHFCILFPASYIRLAVGSSWPALADMGWMIRCFIIIYFVGGFFSPVGWNPVLMMVAGASSALWTNYQKQSWNKATERV